uniref:Baseplate assembly protein V n=1 Tax=Dulem virus 34 TaxID=3145752 RepID=A0AAU8B672_9CAUD
MENNIRLGKISAIDYAAGMVRVVYHEKDDSVTRLVPLISSEYFMPEIGDQVLVLHLSNGTEAGVVMGRPWSEKNKPPEGAAGLYRKDLARAPGEAMIRYDGSTLTIKCAGAISIEAGGAITINGATIDLN